MANSWGGTLATSTGLVFFGDDSGAFAAADAVTGKALWTFQTSQNWKASPMAYQFDGKEYVRVAAGGTHHGLWAGGVSGFCARISSR